MFTGLIEETGRVEAIEHGPDAVTLTVSAAVCLSGTSPGDSIAVNGCCLTATKVAKRGKTRGFQFNLLRETWDVTNLSALRRGSAVNLERALALGQRMGGHFVTGHIDAVGTIRKWEKQGKDWLLDVDVPAALMIGFVPKGSVAVDGISLTVAKLRKRGFAVWIIPHTRQVTNLRNRKVGDPVNLETDLLGKYAQRQLGR
ncbi:MAG: riboflavin synthase [Verrucomicrobiales bacterium]|jgi:riboflavin synthase|nr:riboflavin synthase [Verrucomicrobiales bacterium]MDP6678950.1 riboflavin synthase [Verrucomicrobiota bacterium]MDP6753054.1 riboflavin synthase [Verrucomicrobiota bacterium]